MEETLKTLPPDQLEQMLALVAAVNRAETPERLREIVVFGLAALMESMTCSWTELHANLFEAETNTTVLTIGEGDWDIDKEMASFNRYAPQHPVIRRFLQGERQAMSFSDCLSAEDFKKLEIYQQFYSTLAVEDQLSVGTLQDGIIFGISVNRSRWGFTVEERKMLDYIGFCVFPLYRTLLAKEKLQHNRQPVIEVNINAIAEHSEALGITPREAELLSLVGHGKTNKQIAEITHISEGTVRKHLENAFKSLNVTNRVSAIVKAIEITARESTA